MLILLTSLFSFSLHAKQTGSFVIEVYPDKIKVTSPKKREKTVNIIMTNKTEQSIVSKITNNKNEVLEIFSLRPKVSKKSKKVIAIVLKDQDTLYYEPVSPPFESVELKFNQRPYEIPEKK